MSADIASIAVSAKEMPGQCPVDHSSRNSTALDTWLIDGLRCSAGKREFKLERYAVAHIRDGGDFAAAMRDFRREVADYRKTGFLAILSHDDAARCASAADELRLLGKTMHEAGLTDDAAALIEGATLATPVDVVCPVTGEEATYEFFSVAFCRHAADPADPLYDPSLSAPFTAINTTSDAFAFAMLVRDQALKFWQKEPFEIEDRSVFDLLLRRCVAVWQNMSVNTITSYNSVAVVPERAVCLSPDRARWMAPHNDPVFSELHKSTHAHEMPIRYAARLAAKWSANLFEGKDYVPGRDGQSGGTPVLSFEDQPDATPLPR